MNNVPKPVATAKPVRGREMITRVVPDIFEPIYDPVPLTRDEHYHEGYVDRKLFLVPDSTLEAMKDVVNFEMRPRKSTRYKHQTSFEISDYEHFTNRLHDLLEKLETMESVSEDEDKQKLEGDELNDEKDKDKQKLEGDELPLEHGESFIGLGISRNEDVNPPVIPVSEIQTPKESKLSYKFLISGHFNGDQTPIYIVQEYDGPKLISGTESDFCSSKSDREVTILIAGKFFDENILEEFQGKPLALNIATTRVIIDYNRCGIYNNNFNKVYKFNEADIHIIGEFIQTELSNYVTPMLSLRVKKHRMDIHEEEQNLSDQNDDLGRSTKTPTTVTLYKPKRNSLFLNNDL